MQESMINDGEQMKSYIILLLFTTSSPSIARTKTCGLTPSGEQTCMGGGGGGAGGWYILK